MKKPLPLTAHQKAIILGDEKPLAVFDVRKHLWRILQAVAVGRLIGTFNAFSEVKLRAKNSRPDEQIAPNNKADILALLESLQMYCIGADTPASGHQLIWIIRRLNRTANPNTETWGMLWRDLEPLEGSLEAEMNARKLLIPTNRTAAYLWKSSPFGEAVHNKFRKGRRDISAAGDCIALELGTAAVFHLMRAVEWGLAN